jgi:hypothetical protein
MTKKKDKIRQTQESIRIFRNLNKSRLFQNTQEKAKENQLLEKIQCLSDDLIRIIYSYLSGKAKLFCNYKFDYLEKKMNSFDFYWDFYKLIESFSKENVIDLISKGVLQKYPDIIESIDEFYYCTDVQEYTNARGKRLFHLWAINGLVNHFYDATSPEDKASNINWSIKYSLRQAIKDYIVINVKKYRDNMCRVISQKNWVFEGNTLFLNLDKAFYLYKCFENLYKLNALSRYK